MMPTRRSVMFGLLGAACAPATAQTTVQSDGGSAFGSSWRITVDDCVSLTRIRRRIEAVIAEVDSQMSPYRDTSDLLRFNATPTEDWQPMPKAFCQVAAQSLRIAALTDGAFDPTVGPIVSRLGFGPIHGRAGHYSDIGCKATALRKDKPDLTLDLCGIAKGYALDRIVGELLSAGISDALVEVGGEVSALGHHPNGRPWNVAIADPRADDFAVYRIVLPGQLALATSGHSGNGVTGPIYTSHIIDPMRGQPASPELLFVSVLASKGAEADALATALCALGPEAGPRLAHRLDVAALFLRDTEEGPSEVMTGRFSQHVLA